jgi:hypothetical protein
MVVLCLQYISDRNFRVNPLFALSSPEARSSELHQTSGEVVVVTRLWVNWADLARREGKTGCVISTGEQKGYLTVRSGSCDRDAQILFGRDCARPE